MSDYADPVTIIASLAAIWVFLRWVDYRGTRVAARHPAQPRRH